MRTYEKNLTTGITREYAYLNNQIIGWKETDSTGNSVKRYAATDLLGSVTTVTDESGKVLWSGEYTAFGNVAYGSGDVLYEGMYTGKDIDSETGLTYHWNRWRSEDGSSFISEDPARDGSNWYGYCGNNPINSTDPTGLAPYVNGVYDGDYDPDYQPPMGPQPENKPENKPEEPKQGPTESQKVEVPLPTIYYDNYGNPSSDPHVVTGRNVGDFGYTAKDVFDYIVGVIEKAGLMGKEYKQGEYVCTNFLKDTINLLGLSMKEYFPGSDNRVSNSVRLFNEREYIKPKKGENPGVGVYFFYKVDNNGIDGHAGIVYFDVKGNASILHNGLAKGGNPQVNVYERNNRDFNSFFSEDQRKNDVIYKQIYASHILPTY